MACRATSGLGRIRLILTVASCITACVTATSWGPKITSFTAQKHSCKSVHVSELTERPVIVKYEDVSEVRCLGTCYGVEDCEAALLTSTADQNLCRCLGPKGPSSGVPLGATADYCVLYKLPPFDIEEIVNGNVDTGTVAPDTPTAPPDACSGGQLTDGLCHCPQGRTGQHCQLVNEEICNAQYQYVFGGPTHDLSPLRALSGVRQYIKVAFTTDTMDFFSKVSSQAVHNATAGLYGADMWGGQIMYSLTKFSMNAYENDSFLEAFCVTSHSRLFRAEASLDGTTLMVHAGNGDIIVMALPPNAHTSVYGPTGVGTLSELKKAFDSGAEITTGSAITQTYSNEFLMHMVGQEIKVNEEYRPYLQQSYVNKVLSTSNSLGTFEQTFGGDTHSANRILPSTPVWKVDTCWYLATIDPLDVLELPNDDHLRRAVQQGRRARVVADDLSAVTRTIYLLQDVVVFQSDLYLYPRRSQYVNNSFGIGYQLTATDNSRIECVHRPVESIAMHDDIGDGTVDHLQWFISSRNWTEQLKTDLTGEHISGNKQYLINSARMGADIQLVIDYFDIHSDAPVTMSVSADILIPSADEFSVEVRELLHLYIGRNEYRPFFQTGKVCAFLNLLVSTEKGLSGKVYFKGTIPHQTPWPFGIPLDGGRITWFTNGAPQSE